MAWPEKIFGFIWLSLGIGTCWMAYRIGLGEASSPGPGFIPFLTGSLLIFLSSISLIKSFVVPSNSGPSKIFGEGVRWDKLVLVVAALFAYIFLLPVLGYFVVTFLFLILLGKIIEPRGWKVIWIISILSVVISYLVFGYWLKVQFPKGLFY